jgi:hypothetical protein
VAAGELALSDSRLKDAIEQKGIPIRRDAVTMQLTGSYRRSALAPDDRDQTAILRGGDRVPDAAKPARLAEGLQTVKCLCTRSSVNSSMLPETTSRPLSNMWN